MTKIVYLSATDEAARQLLPELAPTDWQIWFPSHPRDPAALDALADADYVITREEPLTLVEVRAAKELKGVVAQGVGYDHHDLPALRDRGIPFCVTPAGVSAAVAEHTLLLILATIKHLPELDRRMRSDLSWPGLDLRPSTRTLADLRVGIVGFGRIGRRVAKSVAALGASVRVLGRDIGRVVESVEARGLASSVSVASSLTELAEWADVLTLHVPLTTKTRHLIDREVLGRLRDGAVIINTSRGAVIDETALIERLSKGTLRAGLDVFETEPLPAEHPLRRLSTVVLTPHVGAATIDALRAKVTDMIENIERMEQGQQPRDQIA